MDDVRRTAKPIIPHGPLELVSNFVEDIPNDAKFVAHSFDSIRKSTDGLRTCFGLGRRR